MEIIYFLRKTLLRTFKFVNLFHLRNFYLYLRENGHVISDSFSTLQNIIDTIHPFWLQLNLIYALCFLKLLENERRSYHCLLLNLRILGIRFSLDFWLFWSMKRWSNPSFLSRSIIMMQKGGKKRNLLPCLVGDPKRDISGLVKLKTEAFCRGEQKPVEAMLDLVYCIIQHWYTFWPGAGVTSLAYFRGWRTRKLLMW